MVQNVTKIQVIEKTFQHVKIHIRVQSSCKFRLKLIQRKTGFFTFSLDPLTFATYRFSMELWLEKLTEQMIK